MANTGYKGYTTLEEYYVDNGVATGTTKPNVGTDIDYIVPVYDLASCPIASYTNYTYLNAQGSSVWKLTNFNGMSVDLQLFNGNPYDNEVYIEFEINDAHLFNGLYGNTISDYCTIPAATSSEDGMIYFQLAAADLLHPHWTIGMPYYGRVRITSVSYGTFNTAWILASGAVNDEPPI